MSCVLWGGAQPCEMTTQAMVAAYGPGRWVEVRRVTDGLGSPCEDESGWLIEWHHVGELRFWHGGSANQATAWTPHADRAVRFSRQCDALRVLVGLLDGNGRVAEHMFVNVADSHAP